MSFDVYVPCNCKTKNKMTAPLSIEKLDSFLGRFYIKKEYGHDKNLKEAFDEWNNCEHNGTALEYSMAQSVMGFRKLLDEKYPNQFENFKAFIPPGNHWYSTDYDKQKAMKEIKEFHELEDKKYEYRVNQFLKLLQTAIELKQEIYWS